MTFIQQVGLRFAVLGFDRCQLGQPTDMPPAFKLGFDKRVNDLRGERVTGDVGAQREDVAIGMLAGAAGGPGVGAERGASASHFVRGNTDADTVRTDHDAELMLTVNHCFGQGSRDVGVVRWVERGGTKVSHLMTLSRQAFPQAFLELEPGMVAANRDTHVSLPRSTCSGGGVRVGESPVLHQQLSDVRTEHRTAA